MLNENKTTEVDKQKSISQLTMDELIQLNRRLRMEQETQNIIFDLKRNSGERFNYDNRPIVDTNTPVNQLYHHGVLGMKWGVRKDSSGSGKSSSKGHSDYKDALSLRQKSINEMSNVELRKVTERMQLEKQYSKITAKEKSYGQRYVENFAYAAAPVAIATGTSATLKTLTPILVAKGFDENQINAISTALPKIGAAVSFAVTVANDTRSNRSSNPIQLKTDKK